MTGRVSGLSWPVRPAQTRLCGAAPASFVARPRRVAAMLHDGSSSSATQLTVWVLAVAEQLKATAAVVADSEGLVLDQPQGRLLVRPGSVLVLDLDAESVWSVVPLPQFSRLFTQTVRELPIFEDGEVA